MAMLFEWDQKKARSNLAKHGVSFDEASTAYSRMSCLSPSHDPLHSTDEERFVLIGNSCSESTAGGCPYGSRRAGSHHQRESGHQKREETTMKKMRNDPDMLEEYDFKRWRPRKVRQAIRRRLQCGRARPDVAEYFPDHESVNDRSVVWWPSSRDSRRARQRRKAKS